MARIGIVGLGQMGRPVGRHLIAAGHQVVGCDPSERARATAAELGVEVVGTAAEVAERSELVLVLVGFDEEVEEVVFGPGGMIGAMRPGLTLAIGSTLSPGYAMALEARLAGRDVTLLDVPSARGQDALERGEILIFGGGDRVAFDRWLPVLRTFATDVFHLGSFGAGQVAKLANNMILWACMSANDEALRLAEALGVDPEALRTALGHASAQNWSMTTRAEDRPMPWAEKDMRIALEEADGARLVLPLAATVKEAIKGYKIRRGLPTPAPRQKG